MAILSRLVAAHCALIIAAGRGSSGCVTTVASIVLCGNGRGQTDESEDSELGEVHLEVVFRKKYGDNKNE